MYVRETAIVLNSIMLVDIRQIERLRVGYRRQSNSCPSNTHGDIATDVDVFVETGCQYGNRDVPPIMRDYVVVREAVE